jgi:hypothetical protein
VKQVENNSPLAIMLCTLFSLSIVLFGYSTVTLQNELQASLVYQFQDPHAWAENLAIRSDGNILVTRVDVPELWFIDSTTKIGTLVYSFPGVTSLTGITKVGQDSFAVAGLVLDRETAVATPGSNKIWKVKSKGNQTTVGNSISVTNATFLNGITTFDSKREIILMADSTAGEIYQLNLQTKQYSIAITDQTMKPAGAFPIGINGVKVLENYVYYTSSTRQLFCRVPVDKNVHPTGNVQIVANLTGYFLDDFAISQDETAYIATHANDVILEVQRNGNFQVVAGSNTSLEVAGATAVQFGQGNDGCLNLYVTTDGGQVAPVNGTITEPGKIVSLKI